MLKTASNTSGVNLQLSGQADVGNIRITGNTISSTNTNGNINLTPNGTGAVAMGNVASVGTGSAFAALVADSSAAGGFDLTFRTAGSNRWIASKTGAESGANAGSDLIFYRYSDAGAFLGAGITLTRSNGNLAVAGALSKGSGTFRIDHPLPEKEQTHHLVHSFIEGPQVDLPYRGKAKLVAGRAVVDMDAHFGMTPGTFAALCRETQCFTSNEQGWDRVRGSISGSVLTIECENSMCTDAVSWLVIGERKDKHIMETDWTDDNGKVILEPLKPSEPTR